MNPDLPNPAVGGYPGAHAVRRLRRQQLPVPDADQDLLRRPRPAHRRRLQRQRAHRAARLLRHHVLAPRRRRRTRRRAQRHRHAGPVGQRVVPEPQRLRAGLQLEQRRPGLQRRRPSSIRRSTPASSPAGRPAAASPTAIRRSAAARRATRTGTSARSTPLTSTVTVGAAYAGSRRRLPRRQRPRLLQQPARSALPRARQPADADTPPPANIAAAQAIVPGIGLPYAELLRHHRPDAAAVPAVLGRDRRLRQRRATRPTTRSSSPSSTRRWNGLTVNANYTFSRTEDDLAARTGYDFAQDWAVGVNDQPHVLNGIVVYDLPFGAEGQAGSGNRGGPRAGRAAGRCPASRSSARDARSARSSAPATCPTRAPATPTSTRRSRDRCGSTATTATATSSAPIRRPTSTATRSSRRRRFTYGNTPRTLAFDLRNPSSRQPGPQRPARLPAARHAQGAARHRGLQRLQHRRLRRHQHQHHQRRTSGGSARRPTSRGWRSSKVRVDF